ncbi:phycobilisome protein [Geminocystis sp. GBBB08]|uniref:phycobilisome protein n=1 Tax=Geminocystis sp. GBBB08 TaxID=2604140 RepID=UPI0027E245D7|nr:phycobilisome protein [Geminocystis sp. GBBB08]MBL1210832.1 phycobilisome protein [Geminocystis sp. GBBB08]
MYPELQALIHEAEFQYLQEEDLNRFSQEIATLKDRIDAYKILRDEEISIFQGIVDQVIAKFPQENSQKIETTIRHWLLITRYSGMAMMLNNHEFLEHRLLEWLTDIVQAYESQVIFQAIYSLLLVKLNSVLSEDELAHIEPFLAQSNNYLTNGAILAN